MDFTKTLPSNCEVRSIIKYLTAKNKSGAEIHQRLWVVYGEGHVMNVQNVQQWQEMFKEGRTSTHDKEWEGRLHLEIDKITQCVHVLANDDQSLIVTD